MERMYTNIINKCSNNLNDREGGSSSIMYTHIIMKSNYANPCDTIKLLGDEILVYSSQQQVQQIMHIPTQSVIELKNIPRHPKNATQHDDSEGWICRFVDPPGISVPTSAAAPFTSSSVTSPIFVIHK